MGFGGKSRVADIVWDRFGDPINYTEPFAGSLAVLLKRPHVARCETVNDKDCYLANFWRCIASGKSKEVAKFADWPVNEADLHARHQWLVDRVRKGDFREQMMTKPTFCDTKIAGWWVWGISQWIGSGWCSQPHWRGRFAQGSNRGVHRKMFRIQRSSDPVTALVRKRPMMKRSGVGVHRHKGLIDRRVHRTKPDISGDAGAYGRGIHASALDSIEDYFESLAIRLRKVRVCCGDWRRILGPSPTFKIGVTAVFLDPPYSTEADRDPDLYNEEDLEIAHDVREWAIENGTNKLLRIALCGYENEHQMPEGWTCVAWKTNGGYGNQVGNKGKENSAKERIWFSPHCLTPSSHKQAALALE